MLPRHARRLGPSKTLMKSEDRRSCWRRHRRRRPVGVSVRIGVRVELATEAKSSGAISSSSTSSSALAKSGETINPATTCQRGHQQCACEQCVSMSSLSSSVVRISTVILNTNATSTAAMTSVNTLDELCVSAFDESLMDRPTEELIE
ncbi:hypothetical protein PI124_g5248 [Phytophthora idaei]|nr:hypothetical protein PI125_g5977 [Phytophthora idaei]KAG3137523.1 hypothetical protein PI126_g17354 [Phytophthora idaei]KAG3250116.1 hypothetical protein PI124_g5248 [Phytophthora idaei]